MVDIQIRAGEQYIKGGFSSDNTYVDIESQQPVDKPTKPSEFHKFDYTTKQWMPDVDAAWAGVRSKRDRLLAACDWVVTKGVESGAAIPKAWRVYRQALRDITLQTDPLNIVWPVAPDA